MKNVIQCVRSIFSADSGSISSKRICGFIGWIVCLIITLYCSYTNKQAPEITDTVVITSAALLGVDSITGIWKRNDRL